MVEPKDILYQASCNGGILSRENFNLRSLNFWNFIAFIWEARSSTRLVFRGRLFRKPKRGRSKLNEVLFEANGRVACLHLHYSLRAFSAWIWFFALNFGHIGYSISHMYLISLALKPFYFTHCDCCFSVLYGSLAWKIFKSLNFTAASTGNIVISRPCTGTTWTDINFVGR